MQILGPLDMHFDAVVVKIKTFLLVFRLALAILCLSISLDVPNYPVVFVFNIGD